jgi:hypothetical protein
MKNSFELSRHCAGGRRSRLRLITIVFLVWSVNVAAFPSTDPPAQEQPKAATMTTHASGTFDVKITPQKPDNKEAESANLSRMSIDKEFKGDLEGTSKGEMMAASTEVKGSAVYVALERVTGTLRGRTGTFVLQHSGVMTRGTPHLTITVVPDSGTGQLVGLTGEMMINIDNGKHSYEFEYTLPELK